MAEERHALVTGASHGLGRKVVKRLLDEGWRVTAVARTTGELDELIESGPIASLHIACADVSDETAVSRAVGTAIANFGALDAVVHAAGQYGPFGDITTVDVQEWEASLRVNLMGTFFVLRHSLPVIGEDGGTFVALSGGGATSPMPNITSYAASKAAVVRLIESVALEWQARDVDVIAVAPGLLRTQMLDQVVRADPAVVGVEFHDRVTAEASVGRDDTPQAVELISYLVSGRHPTLSGRLLSAVWDPWREWDASGGVPELPADAYRLRRNVQQ